MISNEIFKMLNAQINAEMWAAYLYLSMSLHAELNGYRGVANWFFCQSREELDHSRILQRYVMAQERPVKLMPICGVQSEWSSPLEMFRMALTHEKAVTSMINDIMINAETERDYATTSRMTWFVDEQVEEEENCTELVQKFEKASDAPCYYMQIDYELQKRKYEPPMEKPHYSSKAAVS